MTTQRTAHSQLPSPDEMQRIASHESQRPLPAGRAGVRYVDFAPIIALCDGVGIRTDLFELDHRTSAQILDAGAQLLDGLVGKLLPPPAQVRPLLDSAYNYLCQQDTPQPADLIFVFGGKSTARIEKAVELFRQGLAPRLVISGHGPLYDTAGQAPEARRYEQFALEHGVPAEAIMVEDQSITLVDNVRRSLDLLERRQMSFNSIIIVDSPYTQRRGWCMWRKYLPDDCRIYRVNCSSRYSAEQWFATEDGLRTVLGEFIKLRNAVTFDSV